MAVHVSKFSVFSDGSDEEVGGRDVEIDVQSKTPFSTTSPAM